MTVADVLQRHRLLLAFLAAFGASGRKGAALRQLGGIGHQSLNGLQPVLAVAVDIRKRPEKTDRIRMSRMLEDLTQCTLFDDLAGVHHRHSKASSTIVTVPSTKAAGRQCTSFSESG